jgi:hypothetical protein
VENLESGRRSASSDQENGLDSHGRSLVLPIADRRSLIADR